jgi:hypothetical protein
MQLVVTSEASHPSWAEDDTTIAQIAKRAGLTEAPRSGTSPRRPSDRPRRGGRDRPPCWSAAPLSRHSGCGSD